VKKEGSSRGGLKSEWGLEILKKGNWGEGDELYSLSQGVKKRLWTVSAKEKIRKTKQDKVFPH